MSGFGRKGLDRGPQLTPGQAMAMRAMPAHAAEPEVEAISPQLAAFLANERSRGPAPEPSLSDGATHYSAKQPPRLGQQPAPPTSAPRGEKSMVIAYLLWNFGAPFAAHRFYLGRQQSAMIMMALFWGGLILGGLMSKQSTVSIGGLFVPPPGIAMMLVWIAWIVADLFRIPGLTRKANGPRPELAFT